MIAHLRGIIHSKNTHHIILDVKGVGYQIFLSLNTFYELPPEGMEAALFIHTHLREDQLSLYGFLTQEEKDLFEKLLRVSGVGPKLAITLLSGLSVHEIVQAIHLQEAARLRSIPGIGEKVSQKIILELKGKFLMTGKHLSKASASQSYDEALSALTHLGYTRAHAEQALSRLEWSRGLDLKEAIKLGLKHLSRGS